MTGNPKNTKKPSCEVGFGKPPIEHQFKPGQSGNPRGRPKGKPTMGEIFRRTASELVSVRQGEKIIRITKMEAVIRRLFQAAMEGDIASQKVVLGAVGDDATGNNVEPGSGAQIFDLDDAALSRMLARYDHLRPGKKPK